MKRSIRIALPMFLALALSSAVNGGASVAPVAGTDTGEANITRLTSYLLEHSQFAHRPLDTQLAGKFLDRYLDALDGDHSLFLQSDVDEFAKFRATLVQATREAGDTGPGHTIF